MSDVRAETASAGAGLVQPLFAGLLAAVVGFASSFAVVLQGLTAVGATPVQAASGLLALCVGMGLLSMALSLRLRMPIAVAWSTPGAALLVATGVPEGGFAAATGAFLVTGLLIVAAGIVRPFGRAVSAIPMSLAAAMLAGVLFELCLAPVRAVQAMPMLALPVVLAWAVALRFARLYAVPIAVIVAGVLIWSVTTLPPGALGDVSPRLVPVVPALTFDAVVGIALPLFIVTMASQNLPGMAVLAANGYRPEVAPLFTATGLGSLATALAGGHSLNLSAIVAALCAGPEAHPDRARRWVAAAAFGAGNVLLGLFAAFAAAFVAASPPLLIQAVAGLALLGSLAGALAQALGSDEERLPAILTFVTTASGFSLLGIGAAFWGLLAGGALLTLQRLGRASGR